MRNTSDATSQSFKDRAPQKRQACYFERQTTLITMRAAQLSRPWSSRLVAASSRSFKDAFFIDFSATACWTFYHTLERYPRFVSHSECTVDCCHNRDASACLKVCSAISVTRSMIQTLKPLLTQVSMATATPAFLAN